MKEYTAEWLIYVFVPATGFAEYGWLHWSQIVVRKSKETQIFERQIMNVNWEEKEYYFLACSKDVRYENQYFRNHEALAIPGLEIQSEVMQ